MVINSCDEKPDINFEISVKAITWKRDLTK